MGMLGGTMTPRQPEAAISATAKGLSYPCSIMAGTMTAPMAATVAGPEPEMAPKNIQVMTVTTAKPPVMCPTAAEPRLARRLLSPPPSISPPARMKKGMAISGKESQAVNMLEAR